VTAVLAAIRIARIFVNMIASEVYISLTQSLMDMIFYEIYDYHNTSSSQTKIDAAYCPSATPCDTTVAYAQNYTPQFHPTIRGWNCMKADLLHICNRTST
jgi:hypothetical protein